MHFFIDGAYDGSFGGTLEWKLDDDHFCHRLGINTFYNSLTLAFLFSPAFHFPYIGRLAGM
jgi:hypothetical protein